MTPNPTRADQIHFCPICVPDGLRGNYSTNYTLTQSAGGEQHAVPLAYDVEYDMERMSLNFGNLFNGNKLLGEIIVHRAGDTR